MYRKKAGGWLKHLDFIVLDLLCIQAAFLLAYAVRMGPTSPYRDEAYKEIGIIRPVGRGGRGAPDRGFQRHIAAGAL